MLCHPVLLWTALVLVCGTTAALDTREAQFNDKDIVLDGDPKSWRYVGNAYTAGKPPKPYDDKWRAGRKDTKITVLIAALRESRLVDTLYDLLRKAKHPERVHFGVVQQNAPADEDCMVGLCKRFGTPIEVLPPGPDGQPRFGKTETCKYFKNVRVLRMKHTDAKGPVFARARQRELLQPNDDFCMQIDAHTDGVQDWDEKMLLEWGSTENEYAVITSYPSNIHDMGTNTNGHWEMPHLCGAYIVGPGKISNAQASAAAMLTRPLLTPLWAAGLSFSRCHAERNVPNDPELKGIFSGEEYGRGSRLWTHGYDFYTITRPLIGVWYQDEKQKPGSHMGGSWNTTPEEDAAATKRLTTLLKWPGSDQSAASLAALGSWGMGKRRTLEQYAVYSGVDTIHGTVQNGHCRVQYVPWADDMKSTVYSEYSKTATGGTGVGGDAFGRRQGVRASLRGAGR